jgi:HEAT repeat protein
MDSQSELTVEEILKQLSDVNPDNRSQAINSIRDVQDNRVIIKLIEIVQRDLKVELRWAAISVLGEFRAVEAIPCLITALKDEHYYVRLCAVEALADIGDVRALQPLLDMFEDEDRRITQELPDTLVSFGDVIREPLLSIITRGSDKSRYWAEKTLDKLRLRVMVE